MSRNNIGIMEGRLTPSEGRGIQFFPFSNWEKEFYIAREIGLDEIEFIFDYDNYESNPIWNDSGIEKLKEVIKSTGVKVNSVCFDYFMRRPFFKSTLEKDKLKQENKIILLKVISSMVQLDTKLIEIPLVDASSLSNETEKEEFKVFLIDVINSSNEDIRIGLETDLPPKEFKQYLEDIALSNVGANYDSGNSSGIGYDVREEIAVLNKRIFNVHIKDRIYKGSTVKLGTGSADFSALFEELKKIGYEGSFILQAARGIDGNEANEIKEQMKFIESLRQ